MTTASREIALQAQARVILKSGLTPEQYRERELEGLAAAAQERQRAKARAEEARQRQLTFTGMTEAVQSATLPDAGTIALSLSRKHVDGKQVRLVVLMVEAGIAATIEEAAPLVKTQRGKDLCAALKALGWTNRRSYGGNRPFVWIPPKTRVVAPA